MPKEKKQSKPDVKSSEKVTYLFDLPEFKDAIKRVNREMEETRQEYQTKDRNTQIAAKGIILR